MPTAKSRPLDVIDLVESLGLDVVRRDQSGSGWSDARCPFHEDHHPSFRISADGGWICLALNSCGKGNLAALVSLLAPDVNLATVMAGFVNSEAVQRLLEKPPVQEKLIEDFPYERGKTHQLMFDRGFTAETLRRWDVGWLPAQRTPMGREAVVIPVDFKGHRYGVIYRYVTGKPKYQHPGIPTKGLLFGYDLITDPPYLIVVEGPLDAMWLDQAKEPAVALLGSHLSKTQASLLVAKSRTILLGLDCDEAGEKGTAAALPLLESRAHSKRIHWQPAKDAQEVEMHTLKNLISSAVS